MSFGTFWRRLIGSIPKADPTAPATTDDFAFEPTQWAPEVTYAVVMTSPGRNKVAVIKIVREITDLDLTRAKQLVEQPDGVVVSGRSWDDAQRIRAQLESAGATADVVDSHERARRPSGQVPADPTP